MNKDYNFLYSLYQMAQSLISGMGAVWEFLNEPVKFSITWLRIPIILPEGITFATTIVPLELLAGSIVLLFTLWFIKNLIPIF